MKAHREHRVPLSERAIEIIQTTGGADGPVFRGSNPAGELSNMAMAMLLRELIGDAATVHGFRSTFKDWASDSTDHAREVVEAALAHVIGDKVEAAYRRGDALEKRRKLMDEWADYCKSAAQ